MRYTIEDSRSRARPLLTVPGPRSVFAGFSLFLLASPVLAQWTSVGVGIDYQKFTTSHPNDVFVARMARSNTNAIIGSMIASNRVAGARERVSAQASRYEDALNRWGGTPGPRNDVVVAINGSFFNTSSGVISGGHIYDGWYAKRFENWGGQTGFVWKNDRSCFIGGCVQIVNSEQTVTLGTTSRNYEGINVARAANQLIVYTPQYNNNTLTDASGVEVLVEMSSPVAILDYPAGVTGTVRQVRVGQGATQIPFDHVVLSGVGTAATFLQNNALVGQTVKITADATHYKDGCSTPFGANFDNAFALAQGNHIFLRGGVVLPLTDAGMIIRNPRTFVAYNSSYVFFAVCDGRTAQSVGMTSDEMGAFCTNYLAATEAVNMDGGGSSTMWVNGAVKNNPSDGSERTVANGLMMVNLLPKLVSTAFATGQSVRTTGSANFRLGPGTDYFAFATLANGAQGTIVSNRASGVYAKGYYWWHCNFGGTNGWVAESLLTPANAPPAITQQPANQIVASGGTANFTVLATGSQPLGYQWQKNNTNLANGGHYAGCTTTTLTVSNCDGNDVASYRCVVTNAYGNATSSPATLTLATNTQWATLNVIPIPPWLPGTNDNEGRAISPDGKYVVGRSGTSSWGGYFYDVANGIVRQPNGEGSVPSIVTGIAYRTDPVSGQQQLILDGLSGQQANWMTTDGGLTWGAKRRDTTFTFANLPVANSLAAVTGSDKFYQIVSGSSGSTIRLFTNRGSNTWNSVTAPWFTNNIAKDIPSPDVGFMNGVAATGRAVGYRQTSGVKNHYVLDYPPMSSTAWQFNGLNGTIAGEAFSISANGAVIFGQSPVSGGRPGRWGYKAVVTTAVPGVLQSINELPNFVDTVGSGGSAAVPYGCTADGKYAVGMSYRGMEKAVLWDTSDANPANWTVTDLTDLATSRGILGNFTRLTRAYSIGTNAAGNLVITGVGSYNDGAGPYTRGFVMVMIPTPPPQPRITSVAGAGTTSVTVTWTNTVAGLVYVLQYNTNLNTTNWTSLSPVTASGPTASQTNSPPPGDRQRYYRIQIQ